MLRFRSYTQISSKMKLFILTLLTITTTHLKAQTGLAIGDTVKQFTAKTHNGHLLDLKQTTDSNDVVVIFYRGYWCPFCQRHISTLQDSLEHILDSNARVVLISPENYRAVNTTLKQTKTTIDIISDTTHSIGEIFKVNKNSTPTYKPNYGTQRGGISKQSFSPYANLPIPACYIITKNNVVKWRYFNKDYRHRVSIRQILENL